MSTTCVFENNKSGVNALNRSNPEPSDKLDECQAPKFLFIGCAGTPVPAAQVVGLGSDGVLVHRNVANLVGHTDIQALIKDVYYAHNPKLDALEGEARVTRLIELDAVDIGAELQPLTDVFGVSA